MATKPLAGRVAVVTGAASGMGAATALRLAADGASVALLARRADRLEELVRTITSAGGRAIAVAADVTDDEQIAAAAKRVAAELGRVDLLVNNAGVMLADPITDLRADQWQRMIDTNLTGVLRVFAAFLPALVESAEHGTADLLTVSSLGAKVTFPGYSVYGATKAAASYLSQAVRGELAGKGVRVTAIEPGLTRTELADHVDHPELSAQLDGMFEAVPALAAEDIADLIAYTVSRPKHVNLPTVMILPTQQA
ncbi:SDR family oxidoreductase [Solihabitans fulvus]|uniref:SDR family oxidoreductase n=1 Tax=Solihabitans fulvus TaxID=1892852 RepID=A0A5B2X6Q9_9PSEU|nr:SDR family oxidoreductase [Solihabitans fulvus]